MKKVISILMVMVVFLVGCGAKPSVKKFNVVTSVYPVYDMVYQLAGNDVNVQNIYPPGADIHDYELTAQDMAKITDSDLFLYISDEETPFVKDLKASGKYKTKFVDLSQEVIAKFPESNVAKLADDPHLWVSPQQNLALLSIVTSQLNALNPDGATSYTKKADELTGALKTVDQAYQAFGKKQAKTIYVAHEAYNYLNADYQTDIQGVFGMHHDDEPSAQEITKIIEVIKAKKIKYVYVEQNDLNNAIIKQIATETKCQILELNNMATVAQKDLEKHISFIDILKNNLKNMEKIND